MQSKKVVAVSLILGMLMPAMAAAQATTTSSVQSLLEQLKALQTQMAAIRVQQQAITAQLVTQLKEGSRGDQVLILQQMLAQDPAIYPEGTVSGYYGKLTAAAVKRFQKKHGLDQFGNVGPKTLKKLNELLGIKKDSSKHDDDDDDHDEDRGDRGGRDDREHGKDKMKICHKGETISVSVSAIPAHLMHGDTTGKCNGGGTGTTTPDTAAPFISAIAVNGITTTGAVVTWSTNENATSQLEYGTTTSFGTFSPLNGTLKTVHAVALSGLAPSTQYYFRVWSKDASNNAATSSSMSFTTATPDTSVPLISAVAASSVATTTATITWITNENATGKVYFGAINPLVLGSALTVQDAALSTGHSLNLTGLTASTTYYYVVESKDASNNTATSSQAQFSTTN